MRPMGVLLTLVVVFVLVLCLIPTLWGMVRGIRSRARTKTVVLGIVAVGIVAFSTWAIVSVAPKGARTIAQLKLPDGGQFVLRHYRFGWLEYPKVRFYVRDTDGTWTVFPVISELVDPNNAPLKYSPGVQVQIGDAGGWYQIQEKAFINVDGPGPLGWQMPPGVEPGEEDIYKNVWR